MAMRPSPDALRAAYAEAGEMVRACEAKSASILQFFLALCTAVVTATGAGWLSVRSLGLVLLIAAASLGVLLWRVRDNQGNYYDTLVALEEHKAIGKTLRPHTFNRDQLKGKILPPPIDIAYTILFALVLLFGASIAICPNWIDAKPAESGQKQQTFEIDIDVSINKENDTNEPAPPQPPPERERRRSRLWCAPPCEEWRD